VSIVNLRQARKRKAKDAASQQADANRISHGLSAAERKMAESTQKAQTRTLDGHKLDPTP